MIQKKFIQFEHSADFLTALNAQEVSEKSIVFVKDEQYIWTHGTYFYGDLKDGDLASIRSAIESLESNKVDANYVTSAITTGLSNLEGVHREIVGSLPDTGDASTIYLVAAENGTGNNYDEYMWVKVGANYQFEKIGSKDISLDGVLYDDDIATDNDVTGLLNTVFPVEQT